MIVKVLVENNDGKDICGEHGLCLYVEYKNKKYLIDSGSSDLFYTNALKMGVDIKDVDMAFLSHAHYDHSGGYLKFFEVNKNAKVYLQKSAKINEFYKITSDAKKYIGIPKGILENNEKRFEFVDGMKQIDDGIYVLNHTSSKVIDRAKRSHMCVVKNDEVLFDDFSHEQIIIFEEEDGLVCFNSCSHCGVDVAIEEIKEAFKNKEIKAYFGGFHMMGLSGVSSCSYNKSEVFDVAYKIKEMSNCKFYSGHCTGFVAYNWLEEVLKERIERFYSGKTVEI